MELFEGIPMLTFWKTLGNITELVCHNYEVIAYQNFLGFLLKLSRKLSEFTRSI